MATGGDDGSETTEEDDDVELVPVVPVSEVITTTTGNNESILLPRPRHVAVHFHNDPEILTSIGLILKDDNDNDDNNAATPTATTARAGVSRLLDYCGVSNNDNNNTSASLIVESIDPQSLAANTPLREGDRVQSFWRDPGSYGPYNSPVVVSSHFTKAEQANTLLNDGRGVIHIKLEARDDGDPDVIQVMVKKCLSNDPIDIALFEEPDSSSSSSSLYGQRRILIGETPSGILTSSLLSRGDVVLAINGRNVQGMNVTEANEMLHWNQWVDILARKTNSSKRNHQSRRRGLQRLRQRTRNCLNRVPRPIWCLLIVGLFVVLFILLISYALRWVHSTDLSLPVQNTCSDPTDTPPCFEDDEDYYDYYPDDP